MTGKYTFNIEELRVCEYLSSPWQNECLQSTIQKRCLCFSVTCYCMKLLYWRHVPFQTCPRCSLTEGKTESVHLVKLHLFGGGATLHGILAVRSPGRAPWPCFCRITRNSQVLTRPYGVTTVVPVGPETNQHFCNKVELQEWRQATASFRKFNIFVAFVKFQKATTNFVVSFYPSVNPSVRPSVSSHGTTLIPLNKFS